MKDALFLSFYFPPYAGIEVMRAVKWCKYLPDAGWRPIVLSTTAKGTMDRRMEADLAEVEIVRTARPVLHSPAVTGEYQPNRGWPDWLKKFLQSTVMFPDRYWQWARQGAAMIPELKRKYPHVRAVVATGYPWSAYVLAEQIAEAYGVPIVLDLRDAWTLNPARIWNSGRHRRLEQRLFQKAGGVIVATRSMQEEYAALYPDLAEKLHVIHNGYDPVDRVIVQHMLEDKLHVLHAGFEPSGRKLRVVYTGTFNGHEVPPADHRQSPYYFLLAVQKLRKRMPELASRLDVVFAGKTASRKLVSELGLEDIVTFLGHRSYEETLQLQGSADLLLLFVGPVNRHVLTGKVFEYMATGKPILAMIPTGTELHGLLHDYGGAVVTETKDVDAIAARLGEFVEGTVRLGEVNEPFLESLSRGKQAKMLAAMLEEASR